MQDPNGQVHKKSNVIFAIALRIKTSLLYDKELNVLEPDNESLTNNKRILDICQSIFRDDLS